MEEERLKNEEKLKQIALEKDQQLALYKQQTEQRMQDMMKMLEQYQRDRESIKNDTQNQINSSGMQLGQMITSEILDSSVNTPYRGKTLRFVPSSKFTNEVVSVNQSQRPRRDRSGSFDQSTISTAKMLQRHPVNMNPNDLIELRQSHIPQSLLQQPIVPGMDRVPLGRNEEIKRADRDANTRNERIYMQEFANLRADMDRAGTSRIQDVMGEEVSMKRIHTRDLSQIFKSKKDIYTILMTEGQFYLPPFEDCTMDYLRALMNDQKKVSCSSIISLTVPPQSLGQDGICT